MTVVEYLQDVGTQDKVIDLIQDNILLYQGINTDKKIQDLTGILYNQFVEECVQNNQYISLSNRSILNINKIYQNLIVSLRKLAKTNYTRHTIEEVVIGHRLNLINELINNSFGDTVDQIYIPCAEYTPEFQLDILRLKNQELKEPMIDIGCGKQHGLISLLKVAGYHNVYGIDQYASNDPFLICCNWFEYKFEESSFGTVIAHMSFTNHFRRSLINHDDKKAIYYNKYYEILESLKNGGRFIYTPAVKAIEKGLDNKKYNVSYYSNVEDQDLDTVIIERVP